MDTRYECILIQLSTHIASTADIEFGRTQLGQLNLAEDKRNVYDFDTKVRKVVPVLLILRLGSRLVYPKVTQSMLI